MIGQRGWLWVAAGVAILAGLLLLSNTVLPGLGRMTHGYIGYYTASSLLSHDDWGPHVYNNEWYIATVQRLLNEPIGEVITPNLPTVTLLSLPLVGFSPQTARDIWIMLNVPFLLGAVALLALAPPQRERHSRTVDWWLFAAFALLLPATRANFRIGQAYVVLLLLFALVFVGLYQGYDWLAGIALALAFMLKSSGLPIWIGLIMVRRWRVLGWAVATCVILFAVTLPWIGLDSWLAYPEALRRATSGPVLAVTAYQNTPGFLTHMFRFDATWNPHPLFDIPSMVGWINPVIGSVSLGLTLWHGRRAPAPLLCGALLGLSVVLLPLAEEHQFVLVLPVIAALMHAWRWQGPTLGMLLLAAGVAILLLVPSFYKGEPWGRGWWALLAYPRLYAGWLLWWLLILQLRRFHNQGDPTGVGATTVAVLGKGSQ